jgi:hypothetical protein
MTRRDITLKWIAYLVALAVITIVNFHVLGRLPIAIPLLLPVTAVAVGILEGPKFGAAFGIVVGLVMASAGHKSLLFIPILAIIAWLCGLLSEHALRRDAVGHILSALCIMTLWALYQVLSRMATGVAAPGLLLRIAAGEWFWTVLLSLPVYWVCRFCCVHYGRIYHE